MDTHSSLLVPIGEAARILGVTIKTLRRWDTSGRLITTCRTLGGHRRYSLGSLVTFLTRPKPFEITPASHDPLASSDLQLPFRAVIYGRVSKRDQKPDLVRQLDELKTHALADGYQVLGICSDIASGLNDRRKGLHRLFQYCTQFGLVQRVYISYRDRLARFGTRTLESILTGLGIRLVVTGEQGLSSPTPATSFLDDFVQDFLGILTSFAGKFYRLRKHWRHAGGLALSTS
jgi:predicted site-specific integrase-resolvase